MRAVVITSMVVLVGACGAPPIEADLDTDGVKLPDRTPITDGADGGGSNGKDGASGTEMLGVTVTLAGPGTGTLTSTPSGLACAGTTCKGSFARGTAVTIEAAPAAGSLFGGWSGGCTGSASCAVQVDREISAGADFDSIAGAWSGTYTNTRVAAGCTFNNAGNLGVTVAANGTAFSSSATNSGLELRAIPSCQLGGTTTGTAPSAAVTVATDTITGTWTFAVQGVNGTLAFPFTAKVAGKKITGTWTCPTCTGSFTLTKP